VLSDTTLEVQKLPVEFTKRNLLMNMAAFNPFTFSGRIGRLQFFVYPLLISVAIYLASVIFLAAFGESWPSTLLGLTNTILGVVSTLSYSIRRFHDVGRSGYFVLLLFIRLVNVALALYLLVAPGTKGPNRYGTRESTAVSVSLRS
jgi:uncharacterized membrane protein YhaH (DUF805 family)